MTSLLVEHFDTAGGMRVTRALGAAGDRVADVLAGRTVWCAAREAACRVQAAQLRARVTGAGPDVSAATLPSAAEGNDAGADWVRPDDVVIAHDARTLRFSEAVRERGGHAVFRFRAGYVPTASAQAALELLAEMPACIDAYLLSWREDRGHGEVVERVVAAMPAAGIIAAKEFPLGVAGEDPRPLAWRMAVAEVVRTNRLEAVGGRLHAKPAVAAR
ncbi:MAG: hypothetical protein ACXVY5_00495 [Gaiellales bacterium]